MDCFSDMYTDFSRYHLATLPVDTENFLILTPLLQTVVTCVDGQAWCNFYRMVQCSRQMLHIAVMLHSNFFHFVTS